MRVVEGDGDVARSQGTRQTGTGASAYSAPALEKGLDILELLAGSSPGLTQNQIAARLGRSPSELFRMSRCWRGAATSGAAPPTAATA